MRGKVKYVSRNVWYVGNQEYPHSHDFHDVRCTCTFSVLYNGDEVEIDEDDVRDFYDCSRLTANVIGELNDDLHNVYIEYNEDEDGDYCLDGCLEDYIG